MATSTDNTTDNALIHGGISLLIVVSSLMSAPILNDSTSQGVISSLSEAATVHGAHTTESAYVPTFEVAYVHGVATPTGIFTNRSAEVARISSDVTDLQRNIVSDAAVLGDAVSSGLSSALADPAGVAGVATPHNVALNAFSDSLLANDVITAQVRSDVVDAAVLNDSAAQQVIASDNAVDAAAIHGVAGSFNLPTTNQLEVAELGDAITASQLAVNVVNDSAQIHGVAVVALSGVAWTANTETFAMSRYTQFPFNSVARIGNRLIAAGDGGLYELGEFTDNGAPIAASLTTGLTDVGDPQQKRVREIYLGYEASGAMGVDVAVTMSGAEQTYGYAFPAKTANDPTANRQKVGRGLKSRFWRFIIHNVAGSRFRVNETRADVEPTSRKI